MKETVKSDVPKKSFKNEWGPILRNAATDAAITAARGFAGAIGYKVGSTLYDKMFFKSTQPNLRLIPKANERVS